MSTPIRFNAQEVLGIAEEIEANGAAFYRKAASLKKANSEEAGMLLNLASTEDEHMKTFAAMRAVISSSPDAQQDPDAALYLRAIADGTTGEGSLTAAATLTGAESLQDIIRTAINLERRSILFYLGLVDMVSGKTDRRKVEKIIREEQLHLVTLSDELAKLS